MIADNKFISAVFLFFNRLFYNSPSPVLFKPNFFIIIFIHLCIFRQQIFHIDADQAAESLSDRHPNMIPKCKNNHLSQNLPRVHIQDESRRSEARHYVFNGALVGPRQWHNHPFKCQMNVAFVSDNMCVFFVCELEQVVQTNWVAPRRETLLPRTAKFFVVCLNSCAISLRALTCFTP